MKISKRRYEERLVTARWKAFSDGREYGRQEMARFFDCRIDTPATEKLPDISPANFLKLKAGNPDTVLFFRVSGNYAVYNDDAKVMMKLFSINQPSALVDWCNEKVPVLHFKRGEVPGYIHGVAEMGLPVAIAEPLINSDAEVLHVIQPINQEAA
jgi:hypothetical protein